MTRLLTLLVLLAASTAWAGDPVDDGMAPQADTRMLRELQARAYGVPTLDAQSQRGEVALALAELGLAAGNGTSASGGLGAQDYDALYALLQRYRDELLKMGMESSELEAQLKTLKLRSDEMRERLDNLKPKDGLKFHGRIYSFFDDMHLLGDAPATGPGIKSLSPNKPAYKGMRFQIGGVHSELRLVATRGLLSGYVQYDLVHVWGTRVVYPGVRRVYVEMRLPVTLQFGDIDVKLSPLTLWRNDDYQPFEPEPFLARRLRMREDMLLSPEKWTVQGGRASSEIVLMGKQTLEMESVTFIAGFATIGAVPADPVTYVYKHSDTNNADPARDVNPYLFLRYNTFGEGWRLGLPLGPLTVSNYGLLFWDETDTQVVSTMRALNSLVYSGAVDFKTGIFKAGVEYAISGYTEPSSGVNQPQAAPLTGTALTYAAGIETKDGFVKVFGRSVDNSFFSPGAQGRTQDHAYEYLGPFAMENSQIAADGKTGLDPSNPPRIPVNYANRLNDRLIPPGAVNKPNLVGTGGETWAHLLEYNPLENIDPYGAATPNRTGFGAEAEWKFFKGTIKPKVSYESFSHLTKVIDYSGNLTSPFNMTRMRAGVFVDLKPTLKWPVKFQAGMTADSSNNGKKNLSNIAYDLNSTLMDAGAEWNFVEGMGLTLGYRHLSITGFNETFDISNQANAIGAEPTDTVNGWNYDLLGYGLWWNPVKDVRFDAVYSDLSIAPMKFTQKAIPSLIVSQGVVRMTVFF